MQSYLQSAKEKTKISARNWLPSENTFQIWKWNKCFSRQIKTWNSPSEDLQLREMLKGTLWTGGNLSQKSQKEWRAIERVDDKYNVYC